MCFTVGTVATAIPALWGSFFPQMFTRLKGKTRVEFIVRPVSSALPAAPEGGAVKTLQRRVLVAGHRLR